MRAIGSTAICEINTIEDMEKHFNEIDVIAIFGTNITADYTDVAMAMEGGHVITKDYNIDTVYPTIKESFDIHRSHNPDSNPDDLAFYKGEITSITEIISKEEFLMVKRVDSVGYSIIHDAIDLESIMDEDYADMFYVHGINNTISYDDLIDVMYGQAIFCPENTFYALCDDVPGSIERYFGATFIPEDMPAVYGFKLTTIGELMMVKKNEVLKLVAEEFIKCESFEELCDKSADVTPDYSSSTYLAEERNVTFDEMSKVVTGDAVYVMGWVLDTDFDKIVKFAQDKYGAGYISMMYFYKGEYMQIAGLSKALGVTELKYDQGKVKFSLIPMDKLLELNESVPLDADSFIEAYSTLLTGKNSKEALSYMWGYTMNDLRYDEAIVELAKLYTYGAKKYEAESWKDVDPKRYIDAIGRHKYIRGDSEFDESGFNHDIHLLWNILTCYILL